MHALRTEASHPGRRLHDSNQAVYRLLRHGVQVKLEAGTLTETVHLIDWHHPEKNDFAIAEEVTLKGGLARRPDACRCGMKAGAKNDSMAGQWPVSAP